MKNLDENELRTIISGIIQYCIEEEFIEDEGTIWDVVCEETDTDYDDSDGGIGVIFDELIKEYNL